MNLTRKSFLSLFLATCFYAVSLPVAVSTTGCTKSQVSSLINTLGTASANIAALEGDPTLSAQLKADTAAAVSAVENWQSGSPAQVAIEALNILASDLSLIPGTSQYAALILLAIGTIDALLALIPAPVATASAITAHAVRPHAAVHLENPPKTRAEFRSQWNTICSQKGFTQAKIPLI